MRHASDCAVHNEPAYPAGPCNCGAMRKEAIIGFAMNGVLVFLVFLFIFLIVPTAHAQDPDPALHERFHQYYQTWKQPGMYGLSCCNANEYVDTMSGRMHISGDCEPTRAEIRNGHWWAKVPDYMIEAGVPAWVEIPEDKVIRERNPSSEEGHLCGTVEYWQGKPPTIRILCFVPPDTGG